MTNLSFIEGFLGWMSNPWPFLYSVIMVALLFGGTVLVHELGHFLTAKWFKLRIDAFSIGMGPALWKKKVNGVVYKISLLPIGGYVALPQMDITSSAFEHPDAKGGKLQPVAPWKRIIIAVAGPFMNVVTGFLLCVVVWLVGKPYDAGPGPAIVGRVHQESPAYAAGLRSGDLITAVNGDRIRFWTDVDIAGSLNQEVQLRIVRDGEWKDLPAIPTRRSRIGFLHIPGVRPVEHVEHVYVQSMNVDSPAMNAGVELGDILHEINGEPVLSSEGFAASVQAAEGNPVHLVLLRGEEREQVEVVLTPLFSERWQRHLIGISMMEKPADVRIHPNPFTQMQFFSGSIFRTLRAFTRSRERGEAAQGIGGPVIMLGSIHNQVETDFMQALWFTALINVNLAIINLLPLIILDGGHIMLALYEMAARRAPDKKIVTGMANAMVILLLSLMVFLTFKDINLIRRIHEPWDAEEEQETEQVDAPTDVEAETAP